MWRPLEQHFTWPEPDYEILDEDGIRDVFNHIMDRRHWFFASNHRLEDLEERLVGIVQTNAHRRPNYVYASGRGTRLVRPTQKTEPVLIPRLSRKQPIGDRLGLVVMTGPQFNALRAKYLNPGIRPAGPALACGVVADGKTLIGAFAFKGHSPMFASGAYMLSDFPVAPTDYPRLSKLIVMAAMSREAQHLAQSMLSRQITNVITTAFTNRPVSMKYRGLMKLTSRHTSDKPEWKYQLSYEGPVGQWTLNEALQQWKNRWGRTE